MLCQRLSNIAYRCFCFDTTSLVVAHNWQHFWKHTNTMFFIDPPSSNENMKTCRRANAHTYIHRHTHTHTRTHARTRARARHSRRTLKSSQDLIYLFVYGHHSTLVSFLRNAERMLASDDLCLDGAALTVLKATGRVNSDFPVSVQNLHNRYRMDG